MALSHHVKYIHDFCTTRSLCETYRDATMPIILNNVCFRLCIIIMKSSHDATYYHLSTPPRRGALRGDLSRVPYAESLQKLLQLFSALCCTAGDCRLMRRGMYCSALAKVLRAMVLSQHTLHTIGMIDAYYRTVHNVAAVCDRCILYRVLLYPEAQVRLRGRSDLLRPG